MRNNKRKKSDGIKIREENGEWRALWFGEAAVCIFLMFLGLLTVSTVLIFLNGEVLNKGLIVVSNYMSLGLYLSYMMFLLITSFLFSITSSYYGIIKGKGKLNKEGAFATFIVVLGLISLILVIFLIILLIMNGGFLWQF